MHARLVLSNNNNNNNINDLLKAGRHASWRNIIAKVILSNITQVRKAATGDANIVFNRSVPRCINSQVLKRKLFEANND